MKSTWSVRTFTAVLLLLLPPCHAKAHVGIILAREARGPFIITVFAASELVRGRASDVSVMVQRRDSSEVILDASVSLALRPPRGSSLVGAEPICGLTTPVSLDASLEMQAGKTIIAARREQSVNKLLYAAPVNLPLAGPWVLETLVTRGADSTRLSCEIPVGLPARRLAGLAPYLGLPLLLVALFAMNQWLRIRSGRK